MLTKQQIREIILEKRKTLSKDFILKNSLEIIKKIKETKEFKESENIWLFYPLKWEVNLLPFFEENNWKNIFFPKVIWEDILFWKIEKIPELEKWKFWIYEPKKVDKNIELGLIIIPWLAFSKKWGRIWFWKWFYDKYINSLNKKPKLIWVCFDFQIFENLMQEEWDVKILKIINN